MDTYVFIQRQAEGTLHIQWANHDWQDYRGWAPPSRINRPILGADAPADYEFPHFEDWGD